MTSKELLEEYPLLNKQSMKMPKYSIIGLGDDDKLMDDRGLMIDVFNDWSSKESDKFFWSWLGHVKFILEGKTAYTTPNKVIALNYPCTDIIPQDGDKFNRWYFVYCHECLHQLWDTFEVGKEIQKEGTYYDHDLLNIASDCVINDFLANINTKHKKEPIAGITPKYIEEEYGVKYDRKVDTQKSLYLKILKLSKDKQEELKQNADKFDGKIKPKEVKQSDEEGGGEGGGQNQKHSPDYIKGWHDGIQDVLDKKVDPTKYTPKKVKGDYEQGYNDVIEQIKQGLENGLELNNSDSDSQGGESDLANIPWDMDPQSSKSSQSTQDSADDAQQADKDGDEKKAQDSLNDAKESAQDVADKCKEAASKAKEAAKNASDKGAKKKLEDAAKNCEEKADALEKAIKDADKGKDISKAAQDIANKTKEANDATQNALSEIKEQSNKGDKKSSGNESGDSDSEDSGESGDDSKSSSNKGGSGDGDVNIRELEEDLKRHAEEICKKYKDYTMGTIGEFVKKCKISKTTKGGLMMNSNRGSSAWNKELELTCKQFVNQKLKYMKSYRSTYNRVRRGERAFTSTDLRNGTRIINQGREEIKNKIGFDIALYIDTSGSMSHCIDEVFTAAYSIVDELKATFGKDKNVEASKINLKSFIFTTQMREIPYGKKSKADGGTYNFEDLLKDIYKREANAFLNIVITDGDFGGINQKEVAETIDKMEGLFVLVTNKQAGLYDSLVSAVKRKCGPKLQAIYADNDFTIKK